MVAFECPEDSDDATNPFGSRLSFAHSAGVYSAYELSGTSYADTARYSFIHPSLPAIGSSTAPVSEIDRAARIRTKAFMENGDASISVLYAENTFVMNLGGSTPTPGFHGQDPKHNATFMDGSSRQILQDDRSLQSVIFRVNGQRQRLKRGGEDWTIYPSPRPTY